MDFIFSVSALVVGRLHIMKYHCPLHEGAMQFLASQAMANFCIDRIRPNFVFHCISETTCPGLCSKTNIRN